MKSKDSMFVDYIGWGLYPMTEGLFVQHISTLLRNVKEVL